MGAFNIFGYASSIKVATLVLVCNYQYLYCVLSLSLSSAPELSSEMMEDRREELKVCLLRFNLPSHIHHFLLQLKSQTVSALRCCDSEGG